MTDTGRSNSDCIALTGATGFVGGSIARHLAASNIRVRALYRPHRQRVLPPLSGVEWVPGDLADTHALRQLVASTTAVIHCAGTVRGATRGAFDRANVTGTQCLVEAVTRLPDRPRLLLVSSLAAREPQLSDYAASKREGEAAVAATGPDLNWTILRPAAVYGPGDREMLPLFRSMQRGIAPVPGRGNGRFSLLYVDDLARAVAAWLTSSGGHGETFEIDDGHPGGYDWDSLLGLAAQVLREGKKIHRISTPIGILRTIAFANRAAARMLHYAPMLTPGKVREINHDNWVCDNSGLTGATGWKPKVGLAEGLERTLGLSSPRRQHTP